MNFAHDHTPRRIGIVNSGGDCPGLNAVIASAVKHGLSLGGYEFLGFTKGWEGLLDRQYQVFDLDKVRGISHQGGTILRTTNKGRFGAKAGADGHTRRIPGPIIQQAKESMDALDCEGLIVIGGDGTLSGALQLEEAGVNIVGVPKTIDNDLQGTNRTFGFSTAVQAVVDAMDRIHTTATSHGRTLFVETMGRSAGWIALRAGLAGGADAILLPEFPFELEALVERLRWRNEAVGSSVVVVAEGAQLGHETIGEDDAQGEIHLGGVAVRLMAAIEQMSPGEFDMRHVVLGHIQRGGTPNAADRVIAQAYGVAAMKAYHAGDFGKMVRYNDMQLETVSIREAVGEVKRVTPDALEYITARDLGVFLH